MLLKVVLPISWKADRPSVNPQGTKESRYRRHLDVLTWSNPNPVPLSHLTRCVFIKPIANAMQRAKATHVLLALVPVEITKERGNTNEKKGVVDGKASTGV